MCHCQFIILSVIVQAWETYNIIFYLINYLSIVSSLEDVSSNDLVIDISILNRRFRSANKCIIFANLYKVIVLSMM